jgi:phosphoserine phosphatase
VIPVFVDMDGTLIKGSTSSTEIKSYIKKSGILQLSRNVIKYRLFNRLKLKTWVANQELDPMEYEFNQEVVALLRKLQYRGFGLILATASPSLSTDRVLKCSPLVFQEVICSNRLTNLKGSKKLIAIQGYLTKNEETEFYYIGDSHIDLQIMKYSKSSIFVGKRVHFIIGKYIRRIEQLQNLKTYEKKMWA